MGALLCPGGDAQLAIATRWLYTREANRAVVQRTVAESTTEEEPQPWVVPLGAPALLTDEVSVAEAAIESESFIVARHKGPAEGTIHFVRCPRCDLRRPVAEDEPQASCADPDCGFHGVNPHYRGPPSDGAIVAVAPGVHHVRCPRCLVRRPLNDDMVCAPCANPYCEFIGVNHHHPDVADPEWVGLRPKSRAGVQLRCPACRTPTVAYYSDAWASCPSVACDHVAPNPVYEADGYSPLTPRLQCPRCKGYTPAAKQAPVLACIHDCDFIGRNPRFRRPQEEEEPDAVDPDPALVHDEEEGDIQEGPEHEFEVRTGWADSEE